MVLFASALTDGPWLRVSKTTWKSALAKPGERMSRPVKNCGAARSVAFGGHDGSDRLPFCNRLGRLLRARASRRANLRSERAQHRAQLPVAAALHSRSSTSEAAGAQICAQVQARGLASAIVQPQRRPGAPEGRLGRVQSLHPQRRADPAAAAAAAAKETAEAALGAGGRPTVLRSSPRRRPSRSRSRRCTPCMCKPRESSAGRSTHRRSAC
jgi:hypothetical protein